MKTLIRFSPAVLSFVLLSSELALAGAPPLQWQRTFGGSDSDGAYSVQQTSDGGYIITGWTESYGAGYEDVYLIKTDQNGILQWQNTFGGSDEDCGWSVHQTSDGGYIIAGLTWSYAEMYVDVYLIKTDPNGNSEWQKTFGGGCWNEGYSVQQTSDGGYIIAGYTLIAPTMPSDLYLNLIKTDPNGNSQWQKGFAGSGDAGGYSVQQTSDGGYIIAGSTFSSDPPNVDVYLIKTDPNGNMRWQKTFGGSPRDDGYSVRQAYDGGYIIAGQTESYGAGARDVYLIKTDPNGNSEWQKTFGGTSTDEGFSVQQTSDGGYIIAGYTYSFGAGDYDGYLIKTDPNGNSQWQKTFGGSGRSVQQTADGGYIIAGSSGGDVYLIKLCTDGTLSADLNCNGTVYFEDLAILADQWLQPPGILSADIAPEPGDGIVNFLDFAVFAQDWLETTTP